MTNVRDSKGRFIRSAGYAMQWQTDSLKPQTDKLEIERKLHEAYANALWTGAGALFFWLLFLFIIHRAVVAM